MIILIRQSIDYTFKSEQVIEIYIDRIYSVLRLINH